MGLDNPLHIAIVLVVVLLVFGAKRLPEMGRGLGEGMRGFKSGITGDSREEPSTRQQLPAAGEEPATRSSDTERSREPVA